MQDLVATAVLMIYRVLTAAAAPFMRILLSWRAAHGREDPLRWREKLGVPGLARPEGQLVWLHAVSVGELLSVLRLIGALADARPELHVLVTTSTQSSGQVAHLRLRAGVMHQYLPLDTPGAVRRFLQHWRPDVAIWVESEFWPRLLAATAARGTPMLLLNARVSDRSALRWSKLSALAGRLLGSFTAVLAQDTQSARHLAALGVQQDRLTTPGSLKETAAPLDFDTVERDRLAALWADRPRWVAASTHPGEDAKVLQAHHLAAAAHPGLLLVLVPRHPERGGAVAAEVRAAGLTLAERASGRGAVASAHVYLADTLGEMGLWFDLAPVAFIGGSLVPIGGHNPFEPVAQGAAVLHGPSVSNFHESYARLDAAGGAIEVADSTALGNAVSRLLANSAAQAEAQAQAARTVLGSGAETAIAAALAEISAALDRSSQRSL